MVVTDGIQRAIAYYHAIRDYLIERGSSHKAIVAFSGEHEYGDTKVSESSLNGFPSNDIAEKIQEDPYRIPEQVLIEMLQCSTELYKEFSENESFKRWLMDVSLSATYRR